MAKKHILVGQIGSAHGIKGWVRVHSYTEPIDNIFRYQPWFLSKGHVNQLLRVVESRLQRGRLLARLEGCFSVEQANVLVQSTIFVDRDQFPLLEPNQFYWTDLENLNVYTVQGVYLGKVDHLLATGSNDVLVVQGERKRMIPFLQGVVVKEVNLGQQIMVVDWDPAF